MLEKPLILFDGKCTLCNWAVNFVVDRQVPRKPRPVGGELHKDRKEIFLFFLPINPIREEKSLLY